MTNEEFWKQIETYGKSVKTQHKIPPLILRANKEKLSILAVSRKGQLASLNGRGKPFAYCATRWDEKVPSDCTVGETELDGFFFQLIDSGYGGLGFVIDGTFLGVEWTDLFPPRKK